MEEKQMGQEQATAPKKGNLMLWIMVAIVVTVVGVIFFLRGGYRSASPASVPETKNGSQANSTTVAIQNFAFSPASQEIQKGETVTWTNEDSAPHTIAGDSNSFQSGSLEKGQTFSFTFESTGEFDYHCGVHPSMKGKIIVR